MVPLALEVVSSAYSLPSCRPAAGGASDTTMIHDDDDCQSLSLGQKLQQFPGLAAALHAAQEAREACCKVAAAEADAAAQVLLPSCMTKWVRDLL